MSVFKEFQGVINKGLKQTFDIEEGFVENIIVEMPREQGHGDLSTNAAMVLAGKLKKAPKVIAQSICDYLQTHPDVAKCEIAGPGFVNFDLKVARWQKGLKEILELKEKYGQEDIGQGVRVNVEYVSCNPTGPMHIGHTRGAIYGDALANILQYAGYDVVREFYINDAGSQLDILATSLFLRYQEALTGKEVKIPEGLYPGEYLIPIGKKLAKEHQDLSLEKDAEIIKKFAVKEMMALIKDDLAALGIHHDIFFSEKTFLHDQNKISKVIEELRGKGFIYQGTLPSPKGRELEDFNPEEQLLFKSTEFGDDQDRSLQKRDKSWTYFAAEVAYFKDKIERGFNKLILVLGADHVGYIKRAKAVCAAIDKSVDCIITTCQLVNYMKGGQAIKMSKRSGNFLCASDIMELVGADALRFMMLTRKNDAIIDFDVDQVVDYSKDNPVFYVQYAHVRTNSILNSAPEDVRTIFEEGKFDLSLLSLEEEISLIKKLASWPKVLEGAVKTFEPHRIVFYLQSLAASFHGLWQLCKDGQSYRFIVENNPQLTAARFTLAASIKIIIANGLGLIGVKPMERM
ncbi:arginyl-tRNA synthetase [Candidatus Phycorickettsia trachydisci]|uniref:Arginine--tRNA ligase n=1 Tax=Candidatus Phycorickettsia trachydisci TaxID=2115978 RepID=A0A2P1P715_9RICK|nr:arginine--tRNA ligase [Candidatus Phycorickettsia trachydisci]AVP87062.1 arginyl-tRNA synthetase [Candidatus Phycorickettsia trachydisci]